MRPKYISVRARSAYEGSGTAGWSLAGPEFARLLIDEEVIVAPLGSLSNRVGVVRGGYTNVADLRMPGSNPPLFAWIAVPTFGFLAVGTMLPGRKKTRQGIFLALLLMLVLLGMLVACGGGSSGGTSPPPPPPSKTYTITVVGTSGTISQQTTTSLTVTP
jgi:hypothetical protein